MVCDLHGLCPGFDFVSKVGIVLVKLWLTNWIDWTLSACQLLIQNWFQFDLTYWFGWALAPCQVLIRVPMGKYSGDPMIPSFGDTMGNLPDGADLQICAGVVKWKIFGYSKLVWKCIFESLLLCFFSKKKKKKKNWTTKGRKRKSFQHANFDRIQIFNWIQILSFYDDPANVQICSVVLPECWNVGTFAHWNIGMFADAEPV